MITLKSKDSLGLLLGIGSLLLANVFFLPAYGEIIVPPIPGNQLAIDVQPQVTKDPNTQIYTYSYTVSNRPSSLQEMSFFAIEFAPGTEILNPVAPPGWDFGVHKDQPIASWAAVDIGELPPDYVDDGNVVASPFNLKSGQTMSGFSFQTFAAPADGKFYAQGFTKLPQVSGGEGEISEDSVPPFTEDSYSSITTTPNTPSYGGGRRPAVDGFLVFLNLQRDGDVFVSPATVLVKFAAGGESVSTQNTNVPFFSKVEMSPLEAKALRIGTDGRLNRFAPGMIRRGSFRCRNSALATLGGLDAGIERLVIADAFRQVMTRKNAIR